MAQVNLKPSSKGITALIIIAVVIFFGCTLAYVAVAGKLKGTAAELKSKEEKVAQSKEIAQKLEESKLNYLDARSQIRFLESSVTTSAYVPTLLKQLEYLGKSVNLNVIGVRPQAIKEQTGPRKLSSGAQAAAGNVEAASEQRSQPGSQAVKTKTAPYDELNIDIEVEGKYMNALDFLYKLTSFPKIIAVNNVQMSPAGSEQVIGSPSLNIRMSITAYVLKDDAPVAAPNLPADTITGRNPSSEGRDGNEAG
ncbi:type 4a pilus biogenesis protein PilO [bacterium]|nr:type 4a pilus biogenesis protein PilO [bacterium]